MHSLIHPSQSLLGLCLGASSPDYGGSRIIWNDGTLLPGKTAWYPGIHHLQRHPKTRLCWSCFNNHFYHNNASQYTQDDINTLVEEWKTNLMSLAILFHFLCAQHVSDINISIIRSLRLCWWITTSVVLFSVRCVFGALVWLVSGGVRFACNWLKFTFNELYYFNQ